MSQFLEFEHSFPLVLLLNTAYLCAVSCILLVCTRRSSSAIASITGIGSDGFHGAVAHSLMVFEI